MVDPSQEPKHIACARCRERKVKCDGGKPSCRRCRRNGVECLYVRGKKQQGKSEWVRHLRTFSSQPDKGRKTHGSTESHAPNNPVPYQSQHRPRTSHDVLISENIPRYTRTPSPFHPDTISTPTSAASTDFPSPNTSFSSFSSFDDSTPSPLPPCTPDASILFPQMLIFDPASTYYSNDLFLDYANTADTQAQTYAYPTSGTWAPHTPLTQGEEMASASLEGNLDLRSFTYPDLTTSCYPTSSPNVSNWMQQEQSIAYDETSITYPSSSS